MKKVLLVAVLAIVAVSCERLGFEQNSKDENSKVNAEQSLKNEEVAPVDPKDLGVPPRR